MFEEQHIAIGTRLDWGYETGFGISQADRRQHLYAVGKSGTGKITLLFNLIMQDIEAGRGGGVIDPHGDLAEEVLQHIPRHAEDVVWFAPSDAEHPVVGVSSDRRHLVASGNLQEPACTNTASYRRVPCNRANARHGISMRVIMGGDGSEEPGKTDKKVPAGVQAQRIARGDTPRGLP